MPRAFGWSTASACRAAVLDQAGGAGQNEILAVTGLPSDQRAWRRWKVRSGRQAMSPSAPRAGDGARGGVRVVGPTIRSRDIDFHCAAGEAESSDSGSAPPPWLRALAAAPEGRQQECQRNSHDAFAGGL
jgi:hypothetical protein